MNENRPRSRRVAWTLGTLTIAAAISLPIVVVCFSIFADSEGVWQHLAETVLAEYARNTALLALGVGVTTLVIGVSTAWLVTMCRFPGVTVLRWALLLPLAIPTYLMAYAYTDVLQFSGPVQTWIRDVTGWSAGEYYFPQIRSLGGAIAILSLGLYPYVYLTARAAFLEQSAAVLEVSRTLGAGPWRSFARVALPLARPSVAAGTTLVLMETLAEFGAVDYCAVDTFATGIYRTWMSRGSIIAAAQLSACLLGIVALVLCLEVMARRAARFHHATAVYGELATFRLRGWRAVAALATCVTPVLIGFVLPTFVFARLTWLEGDARAREVFLTLCANSLLLAAIASSIAVALALIIAYAKRLCPTLPLRAATQICGMGYAIPGGVIAIGILIPATWFDHRLNDVTGYLFEWTPGLVLSGSIAAVILGYQTRFLAVSLGLMQAGFARIRPSIDEAASTLGASSGRTLRAVHIPLLRTSLAAAFLLVFVDVIKELPATLLLRPANFDTLAVRVYQLASDERLAEASAGGLVIILIGLLPVILLSRFMDRSRPGGKNARPSP